jgi:alginate O-acetyltransferase complex protein AlgI
LIDVYRGEFPAQRSFEKVALYKTFFPQLIAGPIVRYKDVKASIDSRSTDWIDFAEGSLRFVIGLSQKVILANILGEAANSIFALKSSELGFVCAWLGAVCYFFQIYYDFAGYSNMAIGLGRIFGFHFLENFQWPYSSLSITEFWRRWHISLSSWFRDYLFIPLGGSHCSKARNYLNLYIVFLLCGLWHGAAWNFVFWGLFHGTLLVFEKTQFGQLLLRAPSKIRLGYTWIMVIIGWVFFRCDNLTQAWNYLRTMLGLIKYDFRIKPVQYFVTPELLLAIALACFFSFPRPSLVPHFSKTSGNISLPFYKIAFQYGAFIGAFILSLMYLAGSSFNPFIYFRF